MKKLYEIKKWCTNCRDYEENLGKRTVDENYYDESYVNHCYSCQQPNLKEEELLNILLIGPTGAGKSSLANTFVNDFEGKNFKESSSAASETKHYQIEIFKLEHKTYQIIDTIGIGDTNLTPKEVFLKLARVALLFKGKKINQILFVTRNRFTQQYKEVFDLLITSFGEEIVDYITVVRNGFDKFTSPKITEKDYQSLTNPREFSSKIIEKIDKGTREKIIWVDSPSFPEEDEDGSDVETKKILVTKTREKSRKILMDKLEKWQEGYLPKELENLIRKINKFAGIDEETKEEMRKKREEEEKILNGLKIDFEKKLTEAQILIWELTKKVFDKEMLSYAYGYQLGVDEPANIDLQLLVQNDITLNLEKAKKARNILMIGRTGVGKSSLSNLLANKKLFETSTSSVSVTKECQSELFDDEKTGVTFRVIDTIGLGDTKLKEEEVLSRLMKATERLKNGLHQVLFVVNGRFTKEEVAVFEALRALFGEEVVNYCTIVRNRFPDFQNPIECERDFGNLVDEEEKIREVLEKIRGDFVYLDNPPLLGSANRKKVAEETQKTARKKLLNHLTAKRLPYQVNLDRYELNRRIRNHIDPSEKQIQATQEELTQKQELLNASCSDNQKIANWEWRTNWKKELLNKPDNQQNQLEKDIYRLMELLSQLEKEKDQRQKKLEEEEVHLKNEIEHKANSY